MKFNKLLLVILLITIFQGCMLTKIVTVPMRIGGAAVSIVPVVGDVADDVIDTTADVID